MGSSENKFYGDNVNYTFPAENSAYCLEDYEFYNVNIYDSYGDGMCCASGVGFLKRILDGVLVVFNDGQGNVFDQFFSFSNFLSRVNSVFRVLFHAIRLFY